MNRNNRSSFDIVENVVYAVAFIALVAMVLGVLATQIYCLAHPAVG